MRVYKLTNQDRCTFKGYYWRVGRKEMIKKVDEEAKLCKSHWFHCYEKEGYARMLNPVHAGFFNTRMFVAEAGGEIKVGQGKMGCTELTLLEEVPYSPYTWIETERVLVALANFHYGYTPDWVKWKEGSVTTKFICDSGVYHVAAAIEVKSIYGATSCILRLWNKDIVDGSLSS